MDPKVIKIYLLVPPAGFTVWIVIYEGTYIKPSAQPSSQSESPPLTRPQYLPPQTPFLFLKHKMEGRAPESSLVTPWGRYSYVFSQHALAKLLKHRLISGPPDLLGFYIIGKPTVSFLLPYPNLKFEKIPFRYDIEAYLLYLGFKSDQAKMIFEQCRLDARGPSDINAPNLLQYANEHVTEYYHEPFWATALEVSIVSEVARLKGSRDPKVMEGYLSRHLGTVEEKSFSTLKVEDYIKEVIWRRSANLEQFNAIVLAHLN
ncbi:hypothetical protein MMC31_004518 [Peltigera leucophlebia]|nr:hypothetical protein [Peltigera leucophlebia]